MTRRERLLEVHPWWDRVLDLSRTTFEGGLTLRELISRLQGLYYALADNDYLDERACITAELVRIIGHRLPELIRREQAAADHPQS